MPASNRATSLSSRRRASVPADPSASHYRAVGPGDKRVAKLRRAGESAATVPSLDLSTRLRLFQRVLRNRLEHRDALLDVIRAVNTSLEPARIAELIIERAATWVPAPCWAVVSSDGGGQLAVLAERGLGPVMGAAVYAIADRVLQDGDVFFAADLRGDRRIPDDVTATVVAFPLESRGRRIGAVVGFDPMASSREPRLAPPVLRALRVLLEPAGVALDNSLLLKREQALSVTDDLTSLYNSRYLNQVLRRETKRASRNGRALSLLFIDLDGFKSVNDTHGHLSGSRALVEAAAVIRGSARETDVVARFGGDEFAVVLPDTGAEGAFAVGDRIRERIAAHQFLASEGLELRLTASVGVATLPDVADSSDGLMRAADAAMYLVKDGAKNGIRVAGSSR
jgi:diguanylate cyclase (GGDEF)-like protein